MALFGGFDLIFLSGMPSASFGRRHFDTVFAVRREHAMKPCRVHPQLAYQGAARLYLFVRLPHRQSTERLPYT